MVDALIENGDIRGGELGELAGSFKSACFDHA